MVVLWSGALLAGGLLAARWVSAGFAVSLTVITFLAVELLVLRVSPALPLGLIGFGLVIWTLIGVGGGVAAAVVRPAERTWSRRDHAIAVAALSGVVVVGAWAIVDVVDPAAVHLAWAMFDDAVRDLLSSRKMIADNGISSTSLSQTPLPFGVVASNMAPGRGALFDGALLRHDVSRMAEVWLMVAAGTCLLLGLVVARAVRGLRLLIAVPLSASASLFGLSWWVLGISLYGGFINAAFAIVVLIACWLAYVEGEQRPLFAAIVLLSGSVVILSVWPPLVLCLVGLAAVCVVRAIRRRRSLIVTGIVSGASALVVLYAAAFSLPSAVVGSGALGNEGGFPEVLSPILFGFLTLFDAYLIAGAVRLRQRYVPLGMALVIVGSLGGLLYLLYQRRGKADAWGYYPEKFTWLVLVMLVPMTIGLLVLLISARPPASRAQRVALGSLAIGGAMVALVASGLSSSERISPLIGIVEGRVFGISNAEADAVFEHPEVLDRPSNGKEQSQGRQWEFFYVDSLFNFIPQ